MATYRVPVLKDFSWQPPVKDKDLTEEPGSGILKGDRYIVGSPAASDWTGKEDYIATAKQNDPTEAAHWYLDMPEEGWQVWVDDESAYYIYKSASDGWEIFEVNGADMLKSVYDGNDDGVVDAADKLTDATGDDLNFEGNGGDRSLDMNEDLKIVDGQDIELHGSGGEKAQLAIDTQAAERTLDMAGDLTVEGASIIDQDLSSDAAGVAFGSQQLGGGGATVDEYSTDGTLGGDSDSALPTEKAVATYAQKKGTYVSEYGAIEFTI